MTIIEFILLAIVLAAGVAFLLLLGAFFERDSDDYNF